MSNLLREGEHVIEFGCGCGLPAGIYSLRTKAEVMAIDKPEVVDWAKQLYPIGVTFAGADFNKPIFVGKYDVVIAVDVLEHVREKDIFLQTMASVITELLVGC